MSQAKLLGIVGISGGMCSGKSTVARLLRSDSRFHTDGFAYDLKADVAEWLARKGIDVSIQPKNVMRPIWQAYGTVMRTIHGDDYWVRRLFMRLDKTMAEPGYLVIDDARYLSEFTALRALAAEREIPCVLIRLEISPGMQAARHEASTGELPDPKVLLHPSETEGANYRGFDGYVEADDPVEDVFRGVRWILRNYGMDWQPDVLEDVA